MTPPNKMTVEILWKKDEYIQAESRLNNDPKVLLVRVEKNEQIGNVFEPFKTILQEHFKVVMKQIHDEMLH